MLLATATGAAHALTTLPVWVCSSVALALLTRARKQDAAAFCVGALLGCTLPTNAPPTGTVVTAPIGGRERGDIFALLERIDSDPSRVLGKRVIVSGEWAPARRDSPATVSRRVMTCCAADAVAVGFDVVGGVATPIPTGAWVRVSGTLAVVMLDGEARYRIGRASVRRAQFQKPDENVLGVSGHAHLGPHFSYRSGPIRQKRRALD